MAIRLLLSRSARSRTLPPGVSPFFAPSCLTSRPVLPFPQITRLKTLALLHVKPSLPAVFKRLEVGCCPFCCLICSRLPFSRSFVAAAEAIWIAGIILSDATDVMDDRFNLGQALGGMIRLGLAGTLPELAVTASGSLGPPGAGHRKPSRWNRDADPRAGANRCRIAKQEAAHDHVDGAGADLRGGPTGP